MHLPRYFLLFGVVYWLAIGPLAAVEPVDFAKQIRPLLEQHCVSCHGAVKQKAGLKLDLGKRVLKGSLNGPVIVAKKSAESKLYHALKAEHDVDQMPPTGALDVATIELFRRWIDEGAVVPTDEVESVVQ